MNLAKCIDHTALLPNITENQITQLCNEALLHNFCSVCVNPCYIPLAKNLLQNSNVKICTVIGFPLGANQSDVKAFEAKKAIEAGADEIDMVVNIGWVKSGNWQGVKDDITAVFQACQSKTLKVIFETCLLTDDEIIKLCEICSQIGVAFVKTSTGFSTSGATTEVVQLMKKSIYNNVEIKASGGIRDLVTAQKMLQAGATRLGTSASVAIITNQSTAESKY